MLIPLFSVLATSDEVDFYVGTYTSKEGSKGIYRSQLNTRTGELSTPSLAAEADSPSYLAPHPSGKTLYAIHETDGGEASAYRIEKDGSLTFLNKQPTGGSGPCYGSVDPSGRFLLTAAYGAGSVSCLPLGNNGSLASAVSVLENEGSGPNKDRQDRPHLHAIRADSKSRNVYACDLGTDEILHYRLGEEGELKHVGSGKSIAGGGPRHLVFDRSGRFIYSNNEMVPSVSVYAISEPNGNLVRMETFSTLPEGTPIGRNSTAAIVLHPNGKWLYVSNRGHDSIASFKVLEKGSLEKIEIHPAGVKEPRDFSIDPSGKWLVAAGQNSDDLVSMSIDEKTGKLSEPVGRVKTPKPVCVVFRR